MAVRVGLVGLGLMGKVHFDAYARMKGARVVAICDVDARKRTGDWSSVVSNIGGEGVRWDTSAIRAYARAEQLFADPEIDVVDVTLPTYLHPEASIAALESGKHVICEKPMALTSRQSRAMILAARKARRKLFIAQCVRFSPPYVKARQIVRSGMYGRVLSAAFARLSARPDWSYRDWILDRNKSGSAALDLHIHDTDYILHLLGPPKSVMAHAAGPRRGQFDHIVTNYDYGKKMLVTAEAGWEYMRGFPFHASFRIAMERGTLIFNPHGLMLYPAGGKARKVRTVGGDPYERELRHFIDCIRKNRESDVVTPEAAMRSVKLVEAEIKSATDGVTVRVRL